MLEKPELLEIHPVICILLATMIIMLTLMILCFFAIGCMDEIKEKTSHMVNGVFILLAICAVVFHGIYYTKAYNKSHEDYDEWLNTYENVVIYDNIMSLERENEVSGFGDIAGAFGFVSGQIIVDTESYYYFYVSVDKDTYRLEKAKLDGTVLIKETDDTHYYIYKERFSGTDYFITYVVVPRGTILNIAYNG